MMTLPNETMDDQELITDTVECAMKLDSIIDDLVMASDEVDAYTEQLAERHASGERKLCPGPHWSHYFDRDITQADMRKYLIARLEFELTRLKGQVS